MAPRGSDVVVAAHVAQRGVERIGHEAEVVRLEVARADDQVDVSQPLARPGMVEGWVRLVRDGEDPDRLAIPANEWSRIRPAHAQAIGHSGLSCGSRRRSWRDR